MSNNQRLVRDLLAATRGVAAAEFALVATALFIMLVGMVDIGSAIQDRLILQQAVRAGGQYALAHPTLTTGIQAAVKAALPWTSLTGFAVTVTPPCFCNNAAQADGCATTCSAAGSGSYVLISASHQSSSLLFPTGNCPTITGNCVSYAIRFQ